jgi:hypothetical protein
MSEIITGIDTVHFTSNGTVTTSKIIGSLDTITIEGSSGDAILTGISDPVDDTDCVNMITINKRTWKDSVRVATTGPGTFSSSFANGQIVDTTVTLVTGDGILIKDQASGVENGLYIVNSSGAPTRTSDAQVGYSSTSSTVLVLEGSENNQTVWLCSTENSVFGDNISYISLASSSTSPGGPVNSIQYNDSSTFNGTSDFTFVSGTPNIVNIATANANTIVNIGTDTSHSGEIGIRGASGNVVSMGSDTSVVKFRGSELSTGTAWERNTNFSTLAGEDPRIMQFNTVIYQNGSNAPTAPINPSPGVVTIHEDGLYNIGYCCPGRTTSNYYEGFVTKDADDTTKYFKFRNITKIAGTGAVSASGHLYLVDGGTLKFWVQSGDNAASVCGSTTPGNFYVLKVPNSNAINIL